MTTKNRGHRAFESWPQGWPIAIVLPSLALALDRWLFMEGSLIWPYRGFVYVTFVLAALAHVWVHASHVPTRPRVLAALAGVLYLEAVIVFVFALAMLLPALAAILLGVELLAMQPIPLESFVLVCLGILGLTPAWIAASFRRSASRARIRVAENDTVRPGPVYRMVGAVASIALGVAVQWAFVADPKVSRVDAFPPDIAGLQWHREGSAFGQPIDKTLIATPCGAAKHYIWAPDGRHAAFVRAPRRDQPWSLPTPDTLFGGFSWHHLYVCNAATGAARHLIAIDEQDPGSGRDFDIQWSADSRALRVQGGGRLSDMRLRGSYYAVYALRDRTWYVVQTPVAQE